MPEIKTYFQVPAEFEHQFGHYKSLLTSFDYQEIKTPDQWQQHREEILDYWHSQMGTWPELLKEPNLEYLAEEDCISFKRFKVRIPYASTKGETLKMDAYLLIPKGDGPFPGILDLYYNPEPGAGIDETRRDDIDFGFKLVHQGLVALCIGTPIPIRENILYPDRENPTIQPLSFMAYIAANCHTILASLPCVKADKIGVVGHSMGGKWAMFAASLYDKFACGCWSDPGIVFDESHADINYWEPWYIGWEKERTQTYGFPTIEHPRSGAYKPIFEHGHDLNELQSLMAPRPFFVSGGDCDGPNRWLALNRINEVYELLECPGRIGMSNRLKHKITPEDNQSIIQFLADNLLS